MQININQVHLKSLVRDLGTLLRSARLRNGISLDQAAFLMKVPKEKVFLLEEGNLNAWDNRSLSSLKRIKIPNLSYSTKFRRVTKSPVR